MNKYDEPNGIEGFIREMPIFFKIFGGIILLIVIGTFLFILYKGLTTWISNNNADVITIKCRIIDKRTEIWGGSGDSGASTNYYITFELEDNTRKELLVKANLYGLHVVDDAGELTYQGTRFIEFNRIVENKDI